MLDAGIFGDVSQGYAVALGEAYENFTRWRKINKIQSSQKRFTPGQLLRDGYGFFLNTKGFNARLISQWLFDLVRAHPTGDPRHEMVEVALTLGQNDRPKRPPYLVANVGSSHKTINQSSQDRYLQILRAD